MLAIAFVEDPGVSFIVDSPLTVGDNEYVRGVVNRLLAGIIRKIFTDMWVLPSWRNFFLPLMSPSPAEEFARMDLAATTKRPPVSRRRKVLEKAATLWESRSPLLKKSVSGGIETAASGPADAFLSQTFPTNIVATSSNLDSMEESIVKSFMSVAKDGSPIDSSAPTAATESTAPESVGAPQSPGSKASVNAWKTTRSRNGVHLQKCRHTIPGTLQSVELSRAIININCDVTRVFSVMPFI
jgi:hypothetical protein